MDNLSTKDIVKKYNFKFTKSLGQNFLVDNTVLQDIIAGAQIDENDLIIEIGPGVGTLTKELLKKAKKVCSIELDSDLIPILTEELKEYTNFTLINEDALKADFRKIIGEEQSVKVVANLPYYVTTPIITKLISGNNNFKSLTVMVQKEVGDRMNARPSCKEYGALTLFVKYYCTTEIIRRVPPSAFMPRPKVESIVIKLNKLSEPSVKVGNEKMMFRIIRESFNTRRKTLWNSLKPLSIESAKMEVAFKNAGIDPMRRGETLSLEEFAKLSDSICKEAGL